MDYLMAFVVGGLICVIGQILMDSTKLTPAHVLVLFVTSGAILSGLGIYNKLISIGGAGATIPLPGFGHSLVQGTIQDIKQIGILGVFTGGLKATAAGISSAVLFGYIMALLFNPSRK
jgi:stage V sporulation protein AE